MISEVQRDSNPPPDVRRALELVMELMPIAGRSGLECLFDLGDNPLPEAGLMAACFGADPHAIGDDIGRIAALNHAYVAGSPLTAFADVSVPAASMQVGNRQSSDRNCADAPFRRVSRVAG
jgi:hypothetical protein